MGDRETRSIATLEENQQLGVFCSVSSSLEKGYHNFSGQLKNKKLYYALPRGLILNRETSRAVASYNCS